MRCFKFLKRTIFILGYGGDPEVAKDFFLLTKMGWLDFTYYTHGKEENVYNFSTTIFPYIIDKKREEENENLNTWLEKIQQHVSINEKTITYLRTREKTEETKLFTTVEEICSCAQHTENKLISFHGISLSENDLFDLINTYEEQERYMKREISYDIIRSCISISYNTYHGKFLTLKFPINFRDYLECFSAPLKRFISFELSPITSLKKTPWNEEIFQELFELKIKETKTDMEKDKKNINYTITEYCILSKKETITFINLIKNMSYFSTSSIKEYCIQNMIKKIIIKEIKEKDDQGKETKNLLCPHEYFSDDEIKKSLANNTELYIQIEKQDFSKKKDSGFLFYEEKELFQENITKEEKLLIKKNLLEKANTFTKLQDFYRKTVYNTPEDAAQAFYEQNRPSMLKRNILWIVGVIILIGIFLIWNFWYNQLPEDSPLQETSCDQLPENLQLQP